MCVCIYILWLAITIVPISSNGLHPNSVNWRKRPQWEKEDTNSFSPFLVFRHSSGSLTKLIGHEWGEKTSNYWWSFYSAEYHCYIRKINCRNKVSCLLLCQQPETKQLCYWITLKGFLAAWPFLLNYPKFRSKRWMRKYKSMKNSKMWTWVSMIWKWSISA